MPAFHIPALQDSDPRAASAGIARFARTADELNSAPPVISDAFSHLREIATGIIHPWTEELARRGDLVEGINLDSPEQILKQLDFLDEAFYYAQHHARPAARQ